MTETNILTQAINACMELTGWTEQEVRNVLCAVITSSPEELLEQLPAVIEWCAAIEQQASMIAICKQMPRGVMQIMWDGKELAFRISPQCEVRQTPDGYTIDLPQEG